MSLRNRIGLVVVWVASMVAAAALAMPKALCRGSSPCHRPSYLEATLDSAWRGGEAIRRSADWSFARTHKHNGLTSSLPVVASGS